MLYKIHPDMYVCMCKYRHANLTQDELFIYRAANDVTFVLLSNI